MTYAAKINMINRIYCVRKLLSSYFIVIVKISICNWISAYTGRSFRPPEPAGSLPETTGTGRFHSVPACSLQPDSGRFSAGEIPTTFGRFRSEHTGIRLAKNRPESGCKEHAGTEWNRPVPTGQESPGEREKISIRHRFDISFTDGRVFDVNQLSNKSKVREYHVWQLRQISFFS